MKLELRFQFLISVVVLLTTAASGDAIAVDGVSSSSSSNTMKSIGGKWSELNAQHHRNLQEEVPPKVPPKRSCGQIINIATVAQIKQVASIVVNILLEPPFAGIAYATVEPLITHDVQARVVCASCNEVRELATGRDFDSYCGEDRFAADTEYSSLLLTPFDPETGKAKEGILKPHLSGKSFNTISQHAPTEYWTEDFDAWDTTDEEAITALYTVFYDGWASLMIASGGVVVIAPDYSGYGQTGNSPKLVGAINLYQQVFSVAFLKSKQIVEQKGCTVLSSKFSASGYSEGGYAAVVGTNTLIGLRQKPLNVDTGGAPFNSTFLFANAINTIDNGTDVDIIVQHHLIYGSATFSSKNPDLPNSNVGQNILNEEWVAPLNEATDADVPFAELGPFLPDAATDALNPGFLENTRSTIAEGVIDSCVTTTDGVDDLLCQALQESNLRHTLRSVSYPLSICHSPDDVWVPKSGHAPDVSVNSMLTERTVLGLSPTGGHFENLAFCSFGFVVQFTLDMELAAFESLDDPATCPIGTAAPVSAAPVAPVRAPFAVAPISNNMVPAASVAPVSAVPVSAAPIATMAPNTPTAVAPAAPPLTPAPEATDAPVTKAPSTSAPVTLSPVTSSPVAPPPMTLSPVTSSPMTSTPVAPPPVSPAPVPEPSSPPSGAATSSMSLLFALVGSWATYMVM